MAGAEYRHVPQECEDDALFLPAWHQPQVDQRRPYQHSPFPKEDTTKKKEDVKYLTPEQFAAVMSRCDDFARMTEYNKQRIEALILTMRWTGLRIGDAVVLTADKIQAGDAAARPHQEGQHSGTDSSAPSACGRPGEVDAYYTRVSTDKQADHGVSLDAQLEKIRAMAVVQGAEVAEIIADAGESAKSLDRPGMARLLKLVDAGKVQVVIIAKLDRLTRSVKDLGELLERFQKRGVSLVSVAESLDTGSAAGRLGAEHHGGCESMGA